MNTEFDKKKELKKFLKENDFLELFCEIMEAMTSNNRELIARVTKKTAEFHMGIAKFAGISKRAEKMARCTSSNYIATLALRAADKIDLKKLT